MKTTKTILLNVGAVALWGACGLYAQNQATATIPFAFTAQNTTLPAGEYTMSLAPTAQPVLVVRNNATNKCVMLLAPDSESGYRRATDKSVIVFHQIGDRYFLADVKTIAVSAHVSPSKLERELTADGSSPPPAAVIISALSIR